MCPVFVSGEFIGIGDESWGVGDLVLLQGSAVRAPIDAVFVAGDDGGVVAVVAVHLISARFSSS